MPFWHEPLYLAKVLLTGHSGLLPLPVARYGHCSFTTERTADGVRSNRGGRHVLSRFVPASRIPA